MPSSDDHHKLQTIGIVTAVASSVIVPLLLKYHDRPLFYEHPEGIAYNSGYPVVGHLTSLLKNISRIHDYQIDQYEKLGVLTFTFPVVGNPTTVNTIDPQNIEYFLKGNFKNYLKGPKFNSSLKELLGNGIFNANGENWKYQRKTASFIFNVKNFRDEFTDVFVKEIKIICNDIFNKAVEDKSIIDLQDIMFRFTLDSFVFLGFGVQLNSLLSKEKVPFAVSFDHMQRLGARRFINPLQFLMEHLSSSLTPWKMSTKDHLHILDSFAAEMIAKRRKEIADGVVGHKDLLSRFMNTTNDKGEKLNDTELRDTVLNFIIAGRDTTAQTLSWLFYNLMLHPRIEQKILEEIRDHITDDIEHDPPKLYEAIDKMPYLHAVFYETLRLHPVVPANQKYALEDDVWPDGTIIKAGYYVSWSPYAQGRCTKIWGQDAKEFYPERWIDEEGHLHRESPSKWPAFHVGPRVCLGQNLATLEALVCVAMLLKRYTFELVPGQIVTYEFSLTLPMKDGMKVYIKKRH